MTASLAERALCVIESRLKSIRTEDGYSTDAGLNVFRARRKLADADLPAAVLWDVGDSLNNSTPGSSRDLIDLQAHVEVHAPANQDDTGRTLEAIKADVKRAIRPQGNDCLKDDLGQIGALRYDGAQVFEREDGAASESITLRFIVALVEKIGDPTSSK